MLTADRALRLASGCVLGLAGGRGAAAAGMGG